MIMNLKFFILISVIYYTGGTIIGKLTFESTETSAKINFNSNKNGGLMLEFVGTKVGSHAFETKGHQWHRKFDDSELDIESVKENANLIHYTLRWHKIKNNSELCIHYGDNHWYFAKEEASQQWPLNNTQTIHKTPFVTAVSHHSGVIEPLWLSSSGFAVYVDRSVPLFTKSNGNGNEKGSFCLSANYHAAPFTGDGLENVLVVHLISGKDVKEAYKYVTNRWFKKPNDIPDERVFKSPIWSSWAKFHKGIDQKRVIEFANEIKSHGFPNSHIEIDDFWEKKYGDWTFDAHKFPNATAMVKQLHDMGFRVTLWVYPFINTDSDAFKDNEKYFIKNKLNNHTLLSNWWDGKKGAAHIDFTNPSARNWFVSRLEHIRQTVGIDSFKFDAGEFGWVHEGFRFYDPIIERTPSMFSQLYAETCARLGNLIEVRVGFDSQNLPIMVRMLDKSSVWGYENGLKTLIPAALTFSLSGYHFILPDMIGGNAYGGHFPSKELFIRWVQVNALMPILQFSIVPWQKQYERDAKELIEITHKMIKIHEHFTPLIIQLAKDATKTGDPIIRPLWWIAPNDTHTHTIDDEFLVGNDLLVAPITEDNARKRNIYLPEGKWKDHNGNVHNGGQTLKDFPVKLEELPYFQREI